MTTPKTLASHATRISGFLGLKRTTVGVLAMVVLVGMGERMAERFLPIYICQLASRFKTGIIAYNVFIHEPGCRIRPGFAEQPPS